MPWCKKCGDNFWKQTKHQKVCNECKYIRHPEKLKSLDRQAMVEVIIEKVRNNSLTCKELILELQNFKELLK